MAQGGSRVEFLDLPTEIRLLIYDELLVNRCDPREEIACVISGTNKSRVKLWNEGSPYQRMQPNILRTCKRVWQEATPVCYSDNVFHTDDQAQLTSFLKQIGPRNAGLVRSLELSLSSKSSYLQWQKVFEQLANDATGLRHLSISWAREDSARLKKMLDIVRAIAKIKQLQRLKLNGFYAEPWPAYFEKEMDVQVLTQPYLQVEEIIGRVTENRAKLREHVCTILRHELWKREEFQRGTENLRP